MSDTKTTNPLIARARLPGDTFTLPSQGLFYKNGELDESVRNGEVHVAPMVTLDEIIMKTPDKLFSGAAITEVFERCIPQVKKPLELLSKDIDYLLICLRKVSFGDEVDIAYTHSCENAKEHNYLVQITPFIQQSKKIDPTTVTKNYTVAFPNGQVAHLSPPRFFSMLNIYQTNIEDLTTEELHKNLRETILGVIQSVDEITDKEQISEWIDTIPAGFVHKITDVIEKLGDWGPDQSSKLTCKDCGEEVIINTPLNPISFFT